jgi:DNA-binding CsgD family transcriptional regulator
VLTGVARGHTPQEIAAGLGISHRTVETHRESLMKKLGLHTVAELTRLALEQGLITN